MIDPRALPQHAVAIEPEALPLTASGDGSLPPAHEPWLAYDAQSSETIIHFLARSPAAQALDVHTYETAHRDRVGVLNAATARLASLPA